MEAQASRLRKQGKENEADTVLRALDWQNSLIRAGRTVEKHNRAKPHIRAMDAAKADIKKYGFHEDVDLYDVVLDYLLDEGYAESEDNAITIMVNMSEEWIDDILDEATVMKVTSPSGKQRRLNVAKAKPSVSLTDIPSPSSRASVDSPEVQDFLARHAKLRAIRNTMGQQRVDKKYSDPREVGRFRRRHGFSDK